MAVAEAGIVVAAVAVVVVVVVAAAAAAAGCGGGKRVCLVPAAEAAAAAVAEPWRPPGHPQGRWTWVGQRAGADRSPGFPASLYAVQGKQTTYIQASIASASGHPDSAILSQSGIPSEETLHLNRESVKQISSRLFPTDCVSVIVSMGKKHFCGDILSENSTIET